MSEDRYKRLAEVLGITPPGRGEEEAEPKPREKDETREETREETGEFNIENLSLPATVEMMGVHVVLWELHKINLPWKKEYILTCQIREGKWSSKKFQVPFSNVDELKRRLAREVETYLFIRNRMGIEEARKL